LANPLCQRLSASRAGVRKGSARLQKDAEAVALRVQETCTRASFLAHSRHGNDSSRARWCVARRSEASRRALLYQSQDAEFPAGTKGGKQPLICSLLIATSSANATLLGQMSLTAKQPMHFQYPLRTSPAARVEQFITRRRSSFRPKVWRRRSSDGQARM
jgi:hypothetical protein